MTTPNARRGGTVFRRTALALTCIACLLVLAGCSDTPEQALPPGVISGAQWVTIAFYAFGAFALCVWVICLTVSSVRESKHKSAARIAEAEARIAEAGVAKPISLDKT